MNKGQKVYVIMGNDYPDAVFSDAGQADRHCEKMRERDRKMDQRPRIYWRSYPFKVDARLEPVKLVGKTSR